MEVSTSLRRPKGFNFCSLPFAAQRSVLEKLDLMTFLNLRRCSTAARRLCDSFQFDIYLEVKWIIFSLYGDAYDSASCLFVWGERNRRRTPWNAVPTPCRFIGEKLHLNRMNDPFDDETCTNVLNFLMERRVVVKEVSFLSDIECSTDNLDRFFRTISATRLSSPPCILQTEGIIGHPFLRELECVASMNCLHQPTCSLPTLFFLSLRAPILKMPMVRAEVTAINQYLRQWQQEERDIQLLRISTEPRLEKASTEAATSELLAGLGAVMAPGPVRTTNSKLDKLLDKESFENIWILCRLDAVLYLHISLNAEHPDVCCFSPN